MQLQDPKIFRIELQIFISDDLLLFALIVVMYVENVNQVKIEISSLPKRKLASFVQHVKLVALGSVAGLLTPSCSV
jgi:uncharacterized membrane protein